VKRIARGRLIVFEGGEGAGKSTQLRRLLVRLAAQKVPHETYREPGGTVAGDRIRELLLHHDAPMAPATEAALFIASRAELVKTKVRPALERGTHVVLDRYLLSTYAYQIHGRGLDEEVVRAANQLATEGLAPDLTVLLQLSVGDGLARAAARGAGDRMERADRDFHSRVADAFALFATPAWQAKHPECGPIVAVDASGTEDVVEARVLKAIETKVLAMSGAGALR
jgi:dTMP kinase